MLGNDTSPDLSITARSIFTGSNDDTKSLTLADISRITQQICWIVVGKMAVRCLPAESNTARFMGNIMNMSFTAANELAVYRGGV